MSHSLRLPPESFTATIISIRRDTPSIKSFWLDYGDQPFEFRPGQWIDLFVEIDGKLSVGGYSMTSTPLEKGRIQLAVKSSRHHSVTRYLHEHARVGEKVRISNGQGAFYFEPGMGEQLVLLGAGIGVTPLISILRFLRDTAADVSATLVYSVSTPEEILFREELDSIDRDSEGLRCLFTLTGRADSWRGLRGRINEGLLRALEPPSDARYFFCGSRDFVEGVGEVLRGMGVDEDRLVYERWW